MRTTAILIIAVIIIILIIAAKIRNYRIRNFRANLRNGMVCHVYINEEKVDGVIVQDFDQLSYLVRISDDTCHRFAINDIYP